MRFFSAILSVLGLGASGGAAQIAGDPAFGPEHALMAVRELSADDPEAVRAARALLDGDAGTGTFFEDIMPLAPNMAVIGHGLFSTGRLAHLDWATDTAEALAAFERVFARAGVTWPEGTAAGLAARARQSDLGRGQAVGFVYVALRPLAQASGFEILNLQTGGDDYYFLLAPAQAAERWRSVFTDPDMWIESPDWQFAREGYAGGTLTHVTHPARLRRPPPPPGGVDER